MDQLKIDRINELSKLSRERALTDAEQEERAALRLAYVASIKESLKLQLDNTYIVDTDGNKTKLQE